MQRKTLLGLISTWLVIMLLTLTGCQTIQGLDIEQALLNSASLQSAEASASLKMDVLTSNTDKLSNEDKQMIALLKNLKIDLTSIIMQDKQHLSVDGAISYDKGSIPFRLAVNDSKVVIGIEGAKKPILFDLGTASAKLPMAASVPATDNQQLLVQKIEELIPSIMKFFLHNAPNPDHISVSSVVESVHNETLSLQKAHIEVYGNEIQGLLKTLLTNILADEKGMKELIGQLYDALLPLIQEEMNKSAKDKDASDFGLDYNEMIMPYIENRTLAVEFIHTTLQQLLRKTLKDWDKQVKDSASSPMEKAMFSDKTSLKLDLFIDSAKQIRKANLAVTIPVTDEKSPGIEGVQIAMTSEIWHINLPVTAHTIDIAGGTQDMNKVTYKDSAFLTFFVPTSKAYAFLRHDLKIAKKEVNLTLSPNAADLHPLDASHPFINGDQIAMMPVRFISERLGAAVTWNAASKEITVKDALNDTTIVMALGSRTASVNGAVVEMSSPAMLKNGSTFVPMRFIAEQLGSKVIYDDATHSVTITRE
ncbi:copper amine oxidase N-terminal domain-containing protein [Paenibacillus roseipurpureus]|uniref:Copper amine oxidase N-terminal domain-containing protein n=1 Tax=Paenibacillus roseopurpureus TaxID=2918901 RepID=A0AA96RL15_9BACL|nr:copper amine oxidase N-terminal domain-containing protein [Paenibacillus sp. MBLB1832]WNR44944.1 copper amine oxidase N-terminal domain-containing protein [Paenibacillus sp. MBLB1832]